MWKKLQRFLDRWTSSRVEEEGKLSEQEREFMPADKAFLDTPSSALSRRLIWVMAAIIMLVLLWLCLGHIDEVAVAEGKVIPSGNVKVIQAEDKGVIKRIAVTDGQLVKAGDVLVELDTTITKADLESLRHRAAYYENDISRLLAEQSNSPWKPVNSDSLDAQDRMFLENLYTSRMLYYRTQLSVAESSLRQKMAELDSAETSYQKLSRLYEIAQRKNETVQMLAQQDAMSGFAVMDYQSRSIELEGNIEEQKADMEKASWGVIQAKQQVEAIKAEHEKEITSLLVESRKQLELCREELKKANEKNRLATIVAPIDGRVAQLGIHTAGGVVTAAQGLMEIVPEDAQMEVEAWVKNRDIGFIEEGQEAKIKIETFSFQKYGTLYGTVDFVSPDAIEDKDMGRVYRVVVKVDDPDFVVNGRNASLSSGMSAVAEIKIKEKRIIEFFFDFMKQYQDEALRER